MDKLPDEDEAVQRAMSRFWNRLTRRRDDERMAVAGLAGLDPAVRVQIERDGEAVRGRKIDEAVDGYVESIDHGQTRVLLTAIREKQIVTVGCQYKLSCFGDKCSGGTTSLGLQYDNGTGRDALQKQRKIQAKLSFAY